MHASPEEIERLVQDRLEQTKISRKLPHFRSVWGKYDNFDSIKAAFDRKRMDMEAERRRLERAEENARIAAGDLSVAEHKNIKIQKASERRRQRKAEERLQNPVPPQRFPTRTPQEYIPSPTDQNLPFNRLQFFISQWKEGFGRPDPEWPEEMQQEYTLFVKRQDNFKQYQPQHVDTNWEAAFEYVRQNELIAESDHSRYPQGWLEDFIIAFYESQHIKNLKHKRKSAWSQVTGYDRGSRTPDAPKNKWAAYETFRERLNRMLVKKNAEHDPEAAEKLRRQREREARNRASTNARLQGNPEELAKRRAKDNERNKERFKRQRQEKREAGFQTDFELYCEEYFESQPSFHPRLASDWENVFSHREEWKAKTLTDKLPYPPNWTAEMKRAYRCMRNRKRWRQLQELAKEEGLEISEEHIAEFEARMVDARESPGMPFPAHWTSSMGVEYNKYKDMIYQKKKRDRLEIEAKTGDPEAVARLLAYKDKECRRATYRRATLPHILYSIQQNDLRNGREYALTEQEVARKVKSQCYYCGREPMEEKLNGLDRWNNDIGHTDPNTVPCCSWCNYSKKEFHGNEYIRICCHIACFKGLVSGSFQCPEFFIASQSPVHAAFNHYRRRAHQRDRYFDLTEEEFQALYEGNCVYCGLVICNGIDRLDNELGYCKKNGQPCCKKCNQVKFKWLESEFLGRCVNIYNLWKDMVQSCQFLTLEIQ